MFLDRQPSSRERDRSRVCSQMCSQSLRCVGKVSPSRRRHASSSRAMLQCFVSSRLNTLKTSPLPTAWQVEWLLDASSESQREAMYALAMAGHPRLGAAAAANVLTAELLRHVARFVVSIHVSELRPWRRLRTLSLDQDVFLPMGVRNADDYWSGFQMSASRGDIEITLHYTCLCFLVRLRRDKVREYAAGMRRAYGDSNFAP